MQENTSAPAPPVVQAVARALRILDAFGPDDYSLSLTELSRRLAMGKSTVLRTMWTLAQAGYLVQLEDQRWRLGPALATLGVRYQLAFDAGYQVDATLRKLAERTGETTALFVAEKGGRVCIARVDRPSVRRYHVRAGEALPLDRGAAGHVLLAFSGACGARYDDIRRAGYCWTAGERDRRMSSVAVPVFGQRRRLFGAMCVSGPIERCDRDALLAHLPALVQASETLSRQIAARPDHRSGQPDRVPSRAPGAR